MRGYEGKNAYSKNDRPAKGSENVFKKFASIFLNKFPDRLACLIIIISIFSVGSFAYETVGLPIQTASAEAVATNDSAASAAVNWVYLQKCFGDRINPDSVNTTVLSHENGIYHVKVNFVSLEYKVDLNTGGLHHIPVNHTVDTSISNGKVVSAVEEFRDLINNQVGGPVTDMSVEYL
jgi:hypothetical protein